MTEEPPCIMSLKVPSFLVWSRPEEPKWHFVVVLFLEIAYDPNPERVSYVWCLSKFFFVASRGAALGRVHLGMFYFSDVF